jgi:hypothetical protein
MKLGLRWAMQSVALLVSCVVLFSLGCADDEAKPVNQDDAPPPRAVAVMPTSPEDESLPERISVTGVVTTDLGTRLGGRAVVLLDAYQERHDVVTDDRGRFSLGKIAPPYDLAVAAGPGGSTTVIMGLHRVDPYVELFERDGPTPMLQGQNVRVGVHAPPCVSPPPLGRRANSETSCSVTVVTASASGQGTSTASCGSGAGGPTVSGGRVDGPVVLEVRHAFASASLPGEAIAVHVLTSCRSTAPTTTELELVSYGYSRIDGIVAASGETADIGFTEALPIPAMDPITIGARDGDSELAAWTWTTEISLDLPGDVPPAGFLFALAPSATTTARLPRLEGSNVRVRFVANHPRGYEPGGFHRSTHAWSGAQPAISVMKPAPIAVDVEPGPEVVHPVVGGGISRGESIAWTSSVPALATLAIADTAHRASRFRVLTCGEEVALTHLQELGVPRLRLGAHDLDLSTHPGASTDDATSPDAAVRKRRFDVARPGAATYVRIPFEVTR